MHAEPTIGLVHQLARSGGTIIAKCLGAMQGVALLSEIRPWGEPPYFVTEQRTRQDPVRFLTHEVLRDTCRLRRTCIVRHPADQWASVCRHNGQGLGEVPQSGFKRFLDGHRRFAEAAAEIGFERYEDFAAAPEPALRSMCDRLGVRVDPGWRGKWRENQRITGDETAKLGTRDITAAPRREFPAGFLRQLEANADYRESLALLGYGPALPSAQ